MTSSGGLYPCWRNWRLRAFDPIAAGGIPVFEEEIGRREVVIMDDAATHFAIREVRRRTQPAEEQEVLVAPRLKDRRQER